MRNADAGSALNASVLVLNRFYMPIHVITVRRAFGLLCRELAEVIHIEEGLFGNYDFGAWREMSERWALRKQPDEDWIQSVHFEILAPRVVRLLHYDRVPHKRLRFTRRNLFARDDHCCQYCGRGFSISQLSFDHVIPRSRGGETSWENVVCCCVACNVKKGGRTPQEAHMKLLSKPSRPKQSPLLMRKLGNPKYASWKTFVGGSASSVDL